MHVSPKKASNRMNLKLIAFNAVLIYIPTQLLLDCLLPFPSILPQSKRT